ncbi:MAG: Fe-S oxidoreductase [Firmicutes bacterium]|nr:Fe-S oxidoreductase [Bacillota bacterium]
MISGDTCIEEVATPVERNIALKKHDQQGHLIKCVQPDSIAEELEIEPGDLLLAINQEEIEDVLDYGYLIKDEFIEVLIQKPDGDEWLLEIEKNEDEDLGIEFENSLMSCYRSCSNKCLFCFIDQMPKGMRETLYFKDDDARLSFLQGNYITLTNMREKDIQRIIRLHLSPINISVQSTNPELRCKMLNNRFAGEKLKYMDMLYRAGIEMNGQIVLCKGVNDGAELARSIDDLSAYLPVLRSVSVVPAGITKYREGLFPLELFCQEEAGAVIDMIESRQNAFYKQYGIHFVHASDEWYINAGREFPEDARYDGYVQLENGVGMMRLLLDEFDEALEQIREEIRGLRRSGELKKTLTMATGTLAYPVIKNLADRIMEVFPGVCIHVACIRNDFFGETITVSGLITGQDLIRQLKEREQRGEPLGESLHIPANMLRTGEQIFLDDVTVQEVEASLGVKVVVVEPGGSAFIEAVISADYRTSRNNEKLVYIQAFEQGEESGPRY